MKKFAIVCGAVCLAAQADAQKHLKKSTTYHKIADYDCPNGYVLQGKRCVGVAEEPAIPVCRTGELEDGRCALLSDLNKRCPAGYFASGKQCLKYIEVPLEPVCDDGFMLINGKCEKTNYVAPVCPSGYQEEGKQCVRSSSPLDKCPAGYNRIGKECVKTTNVPLVPECQEGFTLVGNQCEKITYLDPVCPNGYQDDGKKCVQAHPVLRKCPEGFLMKGGQCVQITPIDRVPTCQEGYTLVGKQCEKTIYLEPICPPGYLEEDKQCVKEGSMLKRCPEGFARRGKTCEKLTDVPLVPVCPDDMQLIGDKCEKTIFLDEICPPGSQSSGKGCAMYGPVQKRCPPGHEMVGKECINIVQVPKEPECPPGTVLNGRSCEKTLYLEPICPPGYTDDGKRCLMEDRLLHKCPEGFVREGDLCVKITPVDLIPTCNKGFTLVGNRCQGTKPGQVRPTCDKGKKLVGNDCVSDVRSQPDLNCPKGYTLEGTRCVMKQEYDCSVKTYKTECDGKAHLRHLGTHHRKFEPSYHKKTAPAAPICREVPHIEPKTCTKLLTADAFALCPSGTLQNGKLCLSEISEPAKFICLGGESVENCNRIVWKQPEMICPIDELDGQCRTREEAPLIPYCSDLYELIGDQCLMFADKVCPNGGCDRVLRSPANMICPPGYTDSGKNCSLKNTAPLEFFCENDYTLADNNSRCIKFVDKVCPGGRCDRLTSVPAQKECPLEEMYRGRCQTRELADLIHYCADEFTMIGNRCLLFADKVCPGGSCDRVIHAQPTFVCPVGDEFGKGLCQTVQNADIIFYCANAEHQLIDGKCLWFADKVCPNGNCERVIRTAPNLVCPLLGHRSKGCATKETAPLIPYCLKGQELVGDRCLLFAEKQCPGGSCERVIHQNPRQICPIGESAKGCKRQVEAPFDLFCARGERRGDQCVSWVPASYECSKGSLSKGNVCKKAVTASPLVTYRTECKGAKC